ncbi:MAG: DUF349 domain-containing protein [Prevotella sp.]|nr:DUF349 domain-containing protein [Prevotella sp.]
MDSQEKDLQQVTNEVNNTEELAEQAQQTAPEDSPEVVNQSVETTPPEEEAPAEEPAAEEAPVEETPTEEPAAEEAPVEETPAEEPAAEETPVEEAPVEETPAEDRAAEETPIEETPAEEPAAEETPVEETPVEEAPVEETPVEETPAEEPAAEETPVEEAPVEEAPVEETPAEEPTAEEAPAEEKTEEKKIYNNKKEVLERITEIAHGDEAPQKSEVDFLKTLFYKMHLAEREEQQRKYLEAGGDPATYQITPDPAEEAFKAEMGIIRERRAKLFQEQEAEKQENLKKKLDIIEKIKALATSPDEANKAYQDFKALQQQWREIRAVPAENASELWRNYQHHVEQFYDLLKLNIEAREYDFKKNLEAKTRLCEAAEKLADEPDVISAFHQLQELHQQYRETGPVAKDLREQIWTRFKAASTVINKRHQQHFETLRAKEEENLQRKTALCEQVEAIVAQEIKTASDWDKRTKEIIEIQNEWKTIGFAPQKMNVKIFERFRAACDQFFTKKGEYFKNMKQQFAENADHKRRLIEQAQALKDSTEWRSTSDKFVALQKEWKTIGAVPKKLGDQLWAQFLEACNTFFEARNVATAGTRNEEKENLKQKRGIIAQLKELLENATEDAKERVHQLTEQYNAIGHVPFRDKDKLYKEYREVLDRIYKELNISTQRRRLDNFKNSLKNMAKRGEDALLDERGRLMRRYEQMKQEIQTYENNLGFLNAASKKGNSLIDELNRKVQKLKDDCELLYQKIKAIDQQSAEPKEEEPKVEETKAEEPKAEVEAPKAEESAPEATPAEEPKAEETPEPEETVAEEPKVEETPEAETEAPAEEENKPEE